MEVAPLWNLPLVFIWWTAAFCTAGLASNSNTKCEGFSPATPLCSLVAPLIHDLEFGFLLEVSRKRKEEKKMLNLMNKGFVAPKYIQT